jgi:hypothetical protein
MEQQIQKYNLESKDRYEVSPLRRLHQTEAVQNHQTSTFWKSFAGIWFGL